MSRRTWHPKNSIFQDESYEESGSNGTQPQQHTTPSSQKKRRGKIERRKEPTVVIEKPTLKSYTCDTGYTTIESSSSHNGTEHFYQRTDPQEDTSYLKICGWRENEHAIADKDNLESLWKNRSAPQAREVSSRLYSMKLSYRLSRKQESYQFKHLPNAEDHMNHYLSECSYSSLVLATQKETAPEEFEQMPTVEDSVVTQLPVQYDSSTTSQLHRLASRIGVQHSIRKRPQLLRPPPPSFKQNRTESREGLMISAQGKENETNTATSKMETLKKQQNNSLKELLPEIFEMAKEKQKSTSTISFSKYLHINGETKTDSDATHVQPATESVDSVSSASSSDVTEAPTHNYQPPPKSPLNFSLTDVPSDRVREEVVRRKADSLGLLSHKWAKNFIERGFMNGSLPRKMYYDCSCPATRGKSTSNSSDSTPKQSTKDLSSSSEKTQPLNDIYGSRIRKPRSAWNALRQASVAKSVAQKGHPIHGHRQSCTLKHASATSVKWAPTRCNPNGRNSAKNSAYKSRKNSTQELQWHGPLCTFQQEQVNGIKQKITPK